MQMSHENGCREKNLANLKTSVWLYGNRLQKWADAQTKTATANR